MNRMKTLAISVAVLSSVGFAARASLTPKPSPVREESQSAGFGSMRQLREDLDRMAQDPAYTPESP